MYLVNWRQVIVHLVMSFDNYVNFYSIFIKNKHFYVNKKLLTYLTKSINIKTYKTYKNSMIKNIYNIQHRRMVLNIRK